MNVESRLFEIITAFCFLVGIVYTVLTGEPVGVDTEIDVNFTLSQ